MSPAIYDQIGVGYSDRRRADPRIAAHIRTALGSAHSVVNVGAGTGSYEPEDRDLVAVEPSAEMIRQRPASAAPAVRAVAGDLPFADGAFDAALAILTIHHWPDWRRGLLELRRVARERVVILTYDPHFEGFWLVEDYFPENREIDLRTMPAITEIAEILGPTEVRPIPVTHDCVDGFLGAYWRRPEMYLDPLTRQAISSFSKLTDVESGVARLRKDLETGEWESRNSSLRSLSELDVGYRLLIASGSTPAVGSQRGSAERW